MAANFGAESTDVQELGSSASPRAGVVKEPLGLQAASDVFARVGDALKARKEGKNQSALSEFTKQQLLVAEGVSQGKYKSAFAQTLIRQNLLNAIDANPLLTGDLVKAHSAVTGLSGVNEYLEDGTEAEQRQKRRFDQLVDANLLPHNASQSQFSSADEAARIAQAASDRYKLRSESLQAERDALAVGSARREAVEEKLKDEANQLVAAATPAEMARIQTTLQGYLDSDMPVADKVNAIRDFITTTKAQAAETLGSVDSARREQVESIVTRLEQDYIDRATGKISDAVFEANKKRIETELDMQLLANPELARAASLTRVMGPEGATQMIIRSGNARVYDMVNSFLAGGDPSSGVTQPSFFTSDKTTTQAMKIALDTLAESVSSSDPTVRENATEHMQKVMQNIEDDAGKISRDPKKAIALIDWLASPAFLKARQANPDAFANLEGVDQVLEANYHDEVRGLIKREFTESKVFVRSKRPTRAGREAVPTNELVEAIGTEGGMTFQAIDSDNADARKEAARLNKELKPIINNSIKAQTHLGGTTNYKQSWEKTVESILGVGAGGDADLPGGDAGDDLTLEAFQQDEGPLIKAMSTGGYVGTGDYTDAETPADVAASFIGFKEGEHKDVLSSFIKKATGTNINPSTTAWCAAFVNGALGAKGIKGTGKLNAKSFLNWGQAVTTPTQGDIVVFDRGAPGSWQGHVGFYAGPSDREGYIKVLGGNQDNSVSIKDYPTDRLEGYRRITI